MTHYSYYFNSQLNVRYTRGVLRINCPILILKIIIIRTWKLVQAILSPLLFALHLCRGICITLHRQSLINDIVFHSLCTVVSPDGDDEMKLGLGHRLFYFFPASGYSPSSTCLEFVVM